MLWKECHVMDERLRFVARLLEGEKMAPLCAAFGISRKTGYKIFERYKDCGLTAFTDRSRRPFRQANRLPPPLEATIVRLKREYPGWGAPKIREKLRQQAPDLPHLPAISTVHAVLDRHGLVQRRPRRGHPQQNGRHERMHLTLKREATRPPEANVLQQQARFDAFVERYNEERPHQALGMRVPAAVYTRSPRVYRGLAELSYPYHDATITATPPGPTSFPPHNLSPHIPFAA